MDIFSVLTLIGGLALFLFGMNVMGDSLVKVSGGRLDRILERLTSNRLKGVLLGLGVTAVIQSSSATTVMVVGFVNSGIMKLTQAVGVIMGANIGTTVTSWILSLTGIEGSNLLLSMLKPSSFSPVLAAVGLILTMTASGKALRKDVGYILLGFALLMFGMETMSGAVEPLAEDERFTGILTAFSNPVLGLLAGTVLTAVIQSSSASVGILQALCVTGMVPFSVAIPIIMGQNIGTCVTALLSSIGANRNAKRASMMHLYFNLIGTIVFMIVFYSINRFVNFSFMGQPASAMGVAVVHSLFNIGCCIAWFPFAGVLVKLATLTIPDKKDPAKKAASDELAVLDERFLEKPSFAVQISRDTVIKMAEISGDALQLSSELLQDYRYEDALDTYLLKINSRNLSRSDSRMVSVLLHCISDFECISDHAVNIRDSAVEMHEKKMSITSEGLEELMVYSKAVQDIVQETIQAFQTGNLELARGVEPFEEVIDSLGIEMKQRHITRLRKGKCRLETGLLLDDMINSYERISDHCSNIAAYMLQINEDGFGTHEYLESAAREDGAWFRKQCGVLKEKYRLPERTERESRNE